MKIWNIESCANLCNYLVPNLDAACLSLMSNGFSATSFTSGHLHKNFEVREISKNILSNRH